MDSQRFDNLARLLAKATSRRQVLRGLFAGVVLGRTGFRASSGRKRARPAARTRAAPAVAACPATSAASQCCIGLLGNECVTCARIGSAARRHCCARLVLLQVCSPAYRWRIVSGIPCCSDLCYGGSCVGCLPAGAQCNPGNDQCCPWTFSATRHQVVCIGNIIGFSPESTAYARRRLIDVRGALRERGIARAAGRATSSSGDPGAGVPGVPRRDLLQRRRRPLRGRLQRRHLLRGRLDLRVVLRRHLLHGDQNLPGRHLRDRTHHDHHHGGADHDDDHPEPTTTTTTPEPTTTTTPEPTTTTTTPEPTTTTTTPEPTTTTTTPEPTTTTTTTAEPCELGTDATCSSCTDACHTGHAEHCCPPGGDNSVCTQFGTNTDCTDCGDACTGVDPQCCPVEGGEPFTFFCADLDADAENCGFCGRACLDGQVCCGGECFTLGTPEHCNSCDACAEGEACCDGESEGEFICVDTDVDPNNCGACAGDAGGEVCNAELDCCEGICVDFSSDEGNCGDCGVECDERRILLRQRMHAVHTDTNCAACGNDCTADGRESATLVAPSRAGSPTRRRLRGQRRLLLRLLRRRHLPGRMQRRERYLRRAADCCGTP